MQRVRALLLWAWYMGVVVTSTLVVFTVAHFPQDTGAALAIALLSGAMGLIVIPFFKNGGWDAWLAHMSTNLDNTTQKRRSPMSDEPNGTTHALLTDAIHRGTFGLTVQEHRALKHLPASEPLRDHMSIEELNLLTFAESLALSLHRERDSKGFEAHLQDALVAGEVSGGVRRLMESALGRPVTSSSNFLGQNQPPEQDNRR